MVKYLVSRENCRIEFDTGTDSYDEKMELCIEGIVHLLKVYNLSNKEEKINFIKEMIRVLYNLKGNKNEI